MASILSVYLFFGESISYNDPEDIDICCRQLHWRYKVFWFLEEKKKLYNGPKRANCGDLH